MAKLIVLALAFTALYAFATAHTTIFTTTIENPISKQQCRPQLQGERFNQCQMYLQQDQTPYGNPHQQQEQGIQLCCQELQRIDEECVCEAVTQIFGEAQQMQQRQQGQQGGRFGAQQIQKLKQKAQNIPNKCNIQTEQCQIRTMITTTTITEENPSIFSRGCRQIVQRQPFNQCQRFITQQIRSPRTILMAINKQGQEPQGLQQCCNEIQNIREECQCEAMNEVYNKVIQQQQRQQGVGFNLDGAELGQLSRVMVRMVHGAGQHVGLLIQQVELCPVLVEVYQIIRRSCIVGQLASHCLYTFPVAVLVVYFSL